MMSREEITLVVSEEEDGDRLDHFLGTNAPELSRTRAKAIIEGGLVTVNGRRVKPSTRIYPGDVIHASVPELEQLKARPESIPLEILYEDDDIIVVNKGPGMVVHPAPGTPDGTLVNALMGLRASLSSVGGDLRPGIVHRLDRDTSGVIVVAKNDVAHRRLAAAFEERRVSKVYLALVWGNPGTEAGVIDEPIDRHPRDRKRMAVVGGGKDAVTRWRVRERFSFASLIEARPETGRTHQIRVHMAQVGNPIMGDPTYGGGKRSFGDVSPDHRRHAERVANLASRHALHARSITFDHPTTGMRIDITAPLPDDFSDLLDALRHPDGRAGRVIGVDPGDARIGLAISDEGRQLARPLGALEHLTDLDAARRIASLAFDEGADTIVVGYPIRMDGTRGPRAARAEELAVELENETRARVILRDERLSSAEAERMMRERGEKAKGRKSRVDELAASVILQGYLDEESRPRTGGV
jgi:23S rRNA pseudouridine1911/1915/1917 synthase